MDLSNQATKPLLSLVRLSCTHGRSRRPVARDHQVLSTSGLRSFRFLRRGPGKGAPASLLGDRAGATAVEFALVAAPLVFMLFAILELAMVFLVASTLENATSNVARTIRTGQVQSGGGGSANSIRDSICANLGWLQSQCQANLSVDVRTYAQFTNGAAPSPINNGKFDTSALMYAPGDPGQIVLVRAFYRWTLMTPFLKGALANLDNGVTMLTATTTFKNEPYS
jgi:Flp pilus assembly protein TadG